MKNKAKSKVILSIFADFLLLSLLIAVVIGSIFVSKLVLYPEPSYEGELTVRTEKMPEEYEASLKVGDFVFDTLTKRRVGKITSVTPFHQGEEVYFLLTLDASFKPRSKSLRTRELWFYFTTEDL